MSWPIIVMVVALCGMSLFIGIAIERHSWNGVMAQLIHRYALVRDTMEHQIENNPKVLSTQPWMYTSTPPIDVSSVIPPQMMLDIVTRCGIMDAFHLNKLDK